MVAEQKSPARAARPNRFDRSLLPAAPDLSFELPLWASGVQYVAGIDEAGRGALAGPVAAAAIILPTDPDLVWSLKGVRDSKQMTPASREHWSDTLVKVALAWGVGFATHTEIDRFGIVAATQLAVGRALNCLDPSPQHLLIDFLTLADCPLPQTPLVKGDMRCLSIAAASVLAKVHRDALLRQLDLEFPGYGFASHKGYGTRAHRDAIRRLGSSPIHRQSFTLLSCESEDN